MSARIVCEDCDGLGTLSAPDPRSSSRPCPHCFGRGEIELAADPYAEEVETIEMEDAL